MPRTPSPVASQAGLFGDDPRSDLDALAGRIRNGRPGRRKIAFGWYGGKFSHLPWLLPLLPAARQYCEPFGGSAAVLLNREPAAVETYNDLDGEVANFFRMLRERKAELVEAIGLTPFSRGRSSPSPAPTRRASRTWSGPAGSSCGPGRSARASPRPPASAAGPTARTPAARA